MVVVEIGTGQLRKLTNAVRNIQNGVPKVLAPSINRALNKGRTEIRREIRKVYMIKQKDIPILIKGANRGNLRGAIIIKDHMLDLNKFPYRPIARQTRKVQPMFAQVRKAGGGTISTGFPATVGGYSGPFMRKGAERLPIRKLVTISAAIMASQAEVGPPVNKAMGDTLAKEIDRNIKRVMASAGGHA